MHSFSSGLLLLLYFTCKSIALDGSWNDWLDWHPCSVSCGQGTRKRYRSCNPPLAGGRWCQGKHVQTEKCDTTIPCSVPGGWSEWSKWTECSVTCGQGTNRRFRSCSNPIPMFGGADCDGPPQESSSCVALKACPRDGGWSSWSEWSSCSVTCGAGGSIHRYRACNNPPRQADGKPCEGSPHEMKDCQALQSCAVNGQWSAWSGWTECSVTCGKGERMRRRACDDPPPEHDGKDCDRSEAAEIQIHSCTAEIIRCPVDGGWSEWSDWGPCHTSDCNKPSELAVSLQQRSCNAPLPAHNGSMCQGTFLSAGLCGQPVNCKVDGGWGEWSPWTCTKFVATRERLCNNPPPSRGGKICKGEKVQMYTKDEEEEEYREACPNPPSDDEDLDESSGAGSENAEGPAEDG